MPVHIPLLPEASPIIISETETHVVVAVEIAKATLARHRRFIETLLEAASRSEAGG
jgi:Ribonuclease G/E